MKTSTILLFALVAAAGQNCGANLRGTTSNLGLFARAKPSQTTTLGLVSSFPSSQAKRKLAGTKSKCRTKQTTDTTRTTGTTGTTTPAPTTPTQVNTQQPSTVTPSTIAPPTTSTTAPTTGTTDGTWQTQMLSLVNQERKKGGLQPLCINSALTKAASEFSADMAARNFYDHISPDGKRVYDRIKQVLSDFGSWAENIHDKDESVEQVMKDWMESTVHRENILNGEYTSVGFGHVGTKWTQDFAQLTTTDACK